VKEQQGDKGNGGKGWRREGGGGGEGGGGDEGEWSDGKGRRGRGGKRKNTYSIKPKGKMAKYRPFRFYLGQVKR